MPYVPVTTRIGEHPTPPPVFIPLPTILTSSLPSTSSSTPSQGDLTRPRCASPRCVPTLRTTSCLVPHQKKPTKSSLKCSQSRALSHAHHVRSQSLPDSPKCVQFKDKDCGLESVRHFRITSRPSSISRPLSDTETETESEAFSSTGRLLPLRVADMSPVPSPHPSPNARVLLESVSLPTARPPLLRGTVRVRNIAFEKDVAARFTLDAWTTQSEVHARYTGPATPDGTWDRFVFTIPLEAVASARTLSLAIRYAVPGSGEWWDNNGGENFRVELAPAAVRTGSGPSTAPFLTAAAAAPSARPISAPWVLRRVTTPASKSCARLTLMQYAPPRPRAETNRWLSVA
ncbi:putative phosphatase regulatory subunit-domain-containing protein [Gloeopeniophorella convolvens]|nr:putative phosphatase regulatory subunit-domain-containing protein [Gloeopeniophorella convolvens]